MKTNNKNANCAIKEITIIVNVKWRGRNYSLVGWMMQKLKTHPLINSLSNRDVNWNHWNVYKSKKSAAHFSDLVYDETNLFSHVHVGNQLKFNNMMLVTKVMKKNQNKSQSWIIVLLKPVLLLSQLQLEIFGWI